MTKVVLAECQGQVWLVQGDEHVDAIMNGAVPEGVEVEYLAVTTRGAVIDMWSELSAEAEEGGMPWMINPALLPRLRGTFAPGTRSIQFTPWSVLLDASAQQVLAEATRWVAADAARRLRLRQFSPDPPVPGLADLQRLRAQLTVGALTREGGGAQQVTEEISPATAAADIERMDLIEETT